MAKEVNKIEEFPLIDTKAREAIKNLSTQFQSESIELAGYGKKVIAEAITNKGIKTNNTDTFDQMATNINSIQTGSGGITPTGSIDITKNGDVDVTNYATANVNVPVTENVVGTNLLNKCGSKKLNLLYFLMYIQL